MDEQPIGTIQPRNGGHLEPQQQRTGRAGSIWRNITASIWAVLLVGLIVFIFQNWNRVRFEFLFWTFSTHLSWALFLAALVGMLAGAALVLMIRRKRAAKQHPGA